MKLSIGEPIKRNNEMKKEIKIEISSYELEIFENFLMTCKSSTNDQEIKMLEMLLFYKRLLKKFEEP